MLRISFNSCQPKFHKFLITAVMSNASFFHITTVCLAFLSISNAQMQSCTKCQTSGFAAPAGGCGSQECVIYDLTFQSSCVEITAGANGVAAWKAGLSLTVDVQQLSGKIAAYQIQWFNGKWSGWYIPGVNDIDTKLNGCGMRRMWSYFFDHTHKYIVCK